MSDRGSVLVIDNTPRDYLLDLLAAHAPNVAFEYQDSVYRNPDAPTDGFQELDGVGLLFLHASNPGSEAMLEHAVAQGCLAVLYTNAAPPFKCEGNTIRCPLTNVERYGSLFIRDWHSRPLGFDPGVLRSGSLGSMYEVLMALQLLAWRAESEGRGVAEGEAMSASKEPWSRLETMVQNLGKEDASEWSAAVDLRTKLDRAQSAPNFLTALCDLRGALLNTLQPVLAPKS